MRLFRPLATHSDNSNAISQYEDNEGSSRSRNFRDSGACRFRTGYFLATLLLLISSGACRADFLITIGSTTVNSGGSATVDVMIYGPELFDYYIAEFRIAPLGLATPAGLRFTNPQTIDIVGNSGYVFFNDSAAFDRALTTTDLADDTLSLADFTVSNAGKDVSTAQLLARLNVSALNGLANGTQYQISLVGTASAFEDPSLTSIDFNSSGGLITIQNAAPQAVPVPGTLAAGLIGAGLMSLVGYRRHRQAA
jgi:hypothetical protein